MRRAVLVATKQSMNMYKRHKLLNVCNYLVVLTAGWLVNDINIISRDRPHSSLR